jgi:3-oxoacyl-[acyl-carrier-protein] synthase-1
MIYINSFALNCALGESNEEIATNLFSSELSECEFSTLVDNSITPIFKSPSVLNPLPIKFKKFNTRNNQLALHTLRYLETEIDCLKSTYGSDRIGVVLGTSTSGISDGIDALRSSHTLNTGELPDEYDYYHQEIGSLSDFVKSYLSLNCVSYTISTACTSGARSFIEGKALIENGICDAVIVGGCDTLNDLTLNGFHCLEAISHQRTNPFSNNRDGINIGEGAAFFILSREKSPLALLGTGESSDAYHISSPDPSGKGAVTAMSNAIESAGLKPCDIDYINLHGTGTLKNDEMESLAVTTLFSDQVVSVSSTKPMVGHTLGAAGALEVGFCALCLGDLNINKTLPIHFYDGVVDESISKLSLVTSLEAQSTQICMSNSYAFGGNNASIVLGKINE